MTAARLLAALATAATLTACTAGPPPSPAPDPSTVQPTTTPTRPPVTSPTPGDDSGAGIKGDDLVHIGEDVPAGTYRAVTPVDPGQGCYWSKSSDAEGQQITANGTPTGGRPQVTLKAGQWFTSQGCPAWAHVTPTAKATAAGTTCQPTELGRKVAAGDRTLQCTHGTAGDNPRWYPAK